MGLIQRIVRLLKSDTHDPVAAPPPPASLDTPLRADTHGASPPHASQHRRVQQEIQREAHESVPHARLSQPRTLSDLSGGADRIAVVDCETTGIYPSDRIVELAIVTLDLSGNIVEAWDTLIQPRRHVGATHIHGLTAACLASAPEFGDIAGDVAVRLNGACLAAHNFAFDYRMFRNEFDRVGAHLHTDTGIDTLKASGARLGTACADYDIPLGSAHTAIEDAQAAAALLNRVVSKCSPGTPATVTDAPPRTRRVYRRTDLHPVAVDEPSAIAALVLGLEHCGVEADMLGYLEVLGRALTDLHLDSGERDHLRTFANNRGLTDPQISQAHRRFLNELIDAAIEDDHVTDDELDQLVRVAAALEIDPELVDRRIRPYTQTDIEIELRPHLTVVFTGETEEGERDGLADHAEALGLQVGKSVTKATDLLVAADADSQSTKARKAHRYDIPIATIATFASAQPGDTIPASGSTNQSIKAVTCPDCLATWTAPAKSGARTTKRCTDCRPTNKSPKATTPPAKPQTTERLTCVDCQSTWERQITRGRKPSLCSKCR